MDKRLNNLKPFKPKWKNTPTKAIRVPEKIADQLLEIAKRLDDNQEIDNSNNSIVQVKLREIIAKIDNEEKGYKRNSSGQLIKDIKSILN